MQLLQQEICFATYIYVVYMIYIYIYIYIYEMQYMYCATSYLLIQFLSNLNRENLNRRREFLFRATATREMHCATS